MMFMKKLILASALLISASAMAHGNGFYRGPPQPHFQHKHHHRGDWAWALPPLIAGAIVYKALEPVPQVYVQPNYPQLPTSNCGPWTEYQNSDGSITRSRTCY